MYAKANTSGLGLKSLNNKEFIFKPDYIQEMRKTAIKHYLSTFISRKVTLFSKLMPSSVVGCKMSYEHSNLLWHCM